MKKISRRLRKAAPVRLRSAASLKSGQASTRGKSQPPGKSRFSGKSHLSGKNKPSGKKKNSTSQRPLDVAVIGGGISGVYSAWRLIAEGRERHIKVFEADDRLGGRLLSISPPGIPGMVAELGGMRIMPAVQPRVTRLVKKFKLQTYDFPSPVNQSENISYLRRARLRFCDFQNDPARVPYHLSRVELGRSPDEILKNGMEKIVPGITSPELTEDQRRVMARAATFNGLELFRQGFWNVLAQVVSAEAYHLCIDAGGYESIFGNWNAADAIPWYLTDFFNVEYRAFTAGFQQLPISIALKFKEAGGRIETGQRLEGFDWNKHEKLFDLRFKSGLTAKAKKLILAMPRRSLELLAPRSRLLRARKVAGLIRSVTPRPLFKLYTTYDSPWWRDIGVNIEGNYVPLQKGRSTTDLPLRQVYYWTDNQGRVVESGPAMLMASYDDGLNVGFWDGLRPRRGEGWRDDSIVTHHEPLFEAANRAGSPPEREWHRYHPEERMVREAQRQLAELHDLPHAPAVVNACYKDWGDDPFGGGWNSWNIGVKSWEVKEQIVQPCAEEEVPLFICGEAYSDAQGWVEGALQTADMVLERMGVGS